MQKQQCGICQELKFDKKGNETHENSSKCTHEFVSDDWCDKCGESQYDSEGIETHPNKYFPNEDSFADYDFVSGSETEKIEKRER